jgi:trans-2,3-dihydro-3-hydroxyanthranilate isomerase
MARRNYDFAQLDVFTQTPLAGNPLAVFSDARGLSDNEMQALAREMNLSETTFILPRDSASESKEGSKVRIFTVSEELPFAGHPTLGTALYLRTLNRRTPDEVVLDLRVGKIPVRFNPDSENGGCERVDGQVFGEMRQRDPEFGPTLSREDISAVIGVSVDDIAEEWPGQVVSTGLPFAIVPFRSVKAFTNLKFNVAHAGEFLEPTGARFFYFIYPERHQDRLEVRARMIFYNGEDPATGSAAGCAASWMVRHGVAKSGEKVIIRQGIEVHRPSEIHVQGELEGDRVTNVRVGGYAVEILRGTVTL